MGHSYLIAAYCATWAIQLTYVGWILLKAAAQQPQMRARK